MAQSIQHISGAMVFRNQLISKLYWNTGLKIVFNTKLNTGIKKIEKFNAMND